MIKYKILYKLYFIKKTQLQKDISAKRKKKKKRAGSRKKFTSFK